MHATLTAAMIKPFSKALTCLSKYGDELTIRVLPEGLELSTINSSKSAYANVRLLPGLFEQYIVPNTAGVDGDDVLGCLQTKVIALLSARLVLTSFQALIAVVRPRASDKAVERCELQVVEGEDDDQDSLESKLVVKLHCKHGVTKTHRLVLAHGSGAGPQLDREPRNRVSIGARAVKEMLEHFPPARATKADPQLAWDFDSAEVRVRTRTTGADKASDLSTELSISSDVFDAYDIVDVPLGIAFPLREFTATTSLSEALSSPLDMSISAPGDALQLQIEHNFCTVLCVISTSATSSAPGVSQQSKRPRAEDGTPAPAAPPKRRAPSLAMQPTSQAGSSRHASAAPSISVKGNRYSDAMQLDQDSLSTAPPQAQSTPRPPTQPQAASTPRHGYDGQPLFLPSFTQEDIAGLAASGLGEMTADEVADMMREMEEDDADALPATQAPSRIDDDEEKVPGPNFALVLI
ncbi:hypothetical protein EXIGLDRAFT_714543 [Exidia glandulosa HHB12029]|uniref:Rad9-domain-containing protein n=1 Tax=Exidia glandulosa HHB12029 TaxID=1314781 RepID=A0A165KHN1_EXIGL|nr:hypothetical protein EXIGLDRAFT_714543 [Exidia glandulosa HHB12029]